MGKSPPFVGRRQELQRFDELLRSESGQAILVVGPRGMGKTLLVNRMARCARDHPDLRCGAVRYEVTPADTVNTTMSLMMDHAFEAAQLVERSLEKTEHRSKQWLALVKLLPKGGELAELVSSLRHDPQRNTRDQFIARLQLISERLPEDGRAIFIVDPEKYMQPRSADDWRLVVRDLPEKIKFLFAQRPGGVLITNSDFIALENVLRVPDEQLDVLDEQGVEELMQLRTGDLPVPIGQLREALTRYNRHPYAISAALDLIGDGRALADLPGDPTPERIAEAQWQQICDEHGEKAMELFRALAVLEVAVPDAVVEPVAGLNSIERQKLLANNYIAGLLREEAGGRRIYHSLLADHVLGRLLDEEVKAYHRRAVDIYRERLTADVKPDALAATRLAEHVLATEGTEAFVNAFITECGQFLMTLGLLDSFEGVSKRALELVKKRTSEEAILLGNLGLIYKTRGDLDQAETMHRKALEIEEKLGWLEGMASPYGNLGLIYQARGELDQAEAMHRKSLEIHEKLGRLEGMARQYVNLGVISHKRGDLDRAEKMHRKSLEISEQLGSLEGMANTYGGLGLIYQTRGDLDQGEAMLRKSLEIEEKLGRLEGMAGQYGNLGAIYQTRGDLDQAEKMHRKALAIEEKLGRLEGMASHYGNLGLIYQTRGDLDQGEAMLRKSLEIEEKLGRLEGMASQYGNLGLIYQARGDLDQAEAMHRKSLEINEKLGRLIGMAIAYANLGAISGTRGDLKEARSLWTRARGLYQKIGMPHEVAKIQNWLDELP